MSDSTELMRNSFYLLSARVITLALSFFYTMVLARYLGVNEFGKLTVIMTFLSFFTLVCDFGLNRYIILKVSRTPELTGKYAINMIFLRVLIGLFAFGLMLVMIRLMKYPKEISEPIFIAGFILIPSSIALTFDALFQAKERMGVSSLWQILSTGLTTLSGLLSIYLGLRIKGIIVFLFIATCLNLLIYLFISHRANLVIRSSMDKNFIRQSLRSAFPYAVISLLGFVYLKADTVMLSLMDTEASVGLFGASFRIIEGLWVVPLVLMTAYFPRMSRLSISDRNASLHLYRSSLTLLSILALPLGILCTIFSKEILELIYGSHYGEAAPILSILIWSLVFMYFNAPAGTMIQTSDRFYQFIPFALGNTLFNIALNLILIPKYSAIGASAARVASEITGLIILMVFVAKVFNIEFLVLIKSSLPALVGGGLMIFGIYMMHQFGFNNWKIIFLSCGIYLTVLVFFYHPMKRRKLLFKNSDIR
jgi:O-antigen/teichoic acid export membrane protein